MSECDSCKNKKNWPCQNSCDYMGVCDGWEPKPATNADKLRAMSDEELAEFYCNDADACPPGSDMKCIDELYAHGEGPYPSDEQCRKCWLGWLKEEASE